jgi:hypothetical protein
VREREIERDRVREREIERDRERERQREVKKEKTRAGRMVYPDVLRSWHHSSAHVRSLHEAWTPTSANKKSLLPCFILPFVLWLDGAMVAGHTSNSSSLRQLDPRGDGPFGQSTRELHDLVEHGAHPLAGLHSLDLSIDCFDSRIVTKGCLLCL